MTIFKCIDNTKRISRPTSILEQTNKFILWEKAELRADSQRSRLKRKARSEYTGDVNISNIVPSIRLGSKSKVGNLLCDEGQQAVGYTSQPRFPFPTRAPSMDICLPSSSAIVATPARPELVPPIVLSRYSSFPSRSLPVPGTKPTTMDNGDFKIGQGVRVRKFDLSSKTWSSPLVGVVRRVSHIRGYLGSRAKAYLVGVHFPTAGEDTYSPLMGEICDINDVFPHISPSECWERRTRMNWIYALVPLPNDQLHDPMLVWQPANVISLLDNRDFRVVILSGKLKGQMFDVECVHPYNDTTCKALRSHGQHVMDEGGQVLQPSWHPTP